MQFSVRILDTVVAVDLDDSLPAGTRDEILAQWSHLVDDGEPTATIRVSADGRFTGDDAEYMRSVWDVNPDAAPEPDLAPVPDDLASRLTLLGLQGLAGRAFLLHAAGLATDDGAVIALIGPSGRGKTTASRALGQSMGYVSDETVAIDLDGGVIRYPKPLSIGRRPQTKTLLAPDAAGLTVADAPLRLAALVLLEREPGRPDVVVETVDLIDALTEIGPQSSSLFLVPDALRRLGDLIAATGGVRRVRYGDAEDLPGVVHEILATCRADPEHLEPVDPAAVEARAGTISRAPYAHAAFSAGRAVLLSDRGLEVLGGIGPAVWHCADGVTIEQLRTAVLDAVGSPPDGVDPDQQIDDAVTGLVDAGILTRNE